MNKTNWTKWGVRFLLVLLSGVLIASCASIKAKKSAMTSYIFYASDNPSLGRDVTAGVDWRSGTIAAVVPPGTDVRSLVATFTIPESVTLFVKDPAGGRIRQTNGSTANDFSKPVTYVLVQDDGTESEYVCRVREAETNAALSGMGLEDDVAMTPAFSPDVSTYAASVPYAIADLRIRLSTESQYARVTVAGRQYGGRNTIAAAPLKAGELNVVTVVVTAEDGVTTRTFTLNVERAEPEHDAVMENLTISEFAVLTPDFTSETSEYMVSIAYEETGLAFTPFPRSEVATVEIGGVSVAPGEASPIIPVEAGQITAVKISVIAQDGVTTQTYTVNVQRGEPDHDAALANLTVSEYATLTPDFVSETAEYEVSIGHKETEVAITPFVRSETAIVAVDGKTQPSGEASAALLLGEEETKVVTISVTAQDGTTVRNYTLKATRRPIDSTFVLAAADPGFSERFGFEAVVFNGRLWIIGGSTTNMDYMNDIWYTQDGESWTRATENPGFPPRRNHQVIVHQNKLWLLGGETGGYEYENDVWTSQDGVYWVKLNVESPFPKRINHQAVSFKGKMWVIGGRGPEATGRSVWSSKDGTSWTEEIAEAAFPPRDMHQLLVFNGKLWIIGGQGDSERYADVWVSNDGVTWTRVTDSAAFPPRMAHESAVFSGRLWVGGGYAEGYTPAQDIWYSKDGESWRLATDSADFGGRIGHQMVTYKGRLWIIGGISGTASRKDVWRSDAVE